MTCVLRRQKGNQVRLPSSERRFVVCADTATRLAVAADWLRAQPPDAELLVVGPSWHACDELVRTLATDGAARFGIARLTFDRLAVELATPWLLAEGRARARGEAGGGGVWRRRLREKLEWRETKSALAFISRSFNIGTKQLHPRRMDRRAKP